MRYLKTYESWNTRVVEPNIDKELKETITDIVNYECDLDEIKYIIDFSNYYKKTGDYYPAMIIYFSDIRNRFFRIRNFEDTLLRIKDVCDLFGYSVDVDIPSEDESQMTFDEFLSNFEHDELFRFRLNIYKNEINESFEDKESKRYNLISDVENKVNDIFMDVDEINIRFIPLARKKGAKTDTYNVVKNDIIIGQIKWSSRMRGYAFLPTSDCDSEIKDFIKDLMIKRKMDKLNEASNIDLYNNVKESKIYKNREFYSSSQKNTLNTIEDICLDLKDRNFYVNTGIGSSLDIRLKHYIIIGGPVLDDPTENSYFNFKDVKDELLRLKSYLGEKWIKCGVLFTGEIDRIEVDINEEDYDNLDQWFSSEINNLVIFFNI